jgi:hypothetical protein
VPKPHAGPRFNLERPQRLHLRLGKTTHVALTKLRVAAQLFGALRYRFLDLLCGQLEAGGRPVIETFAEFTHGLQSAASERIQHLGDISDRFRIRFEKTMPAFFDDLHACV